MEQGGAAAERAEDECGHISPELTAQVTVIDFICVPQVIDLFPRGESLCSPLWTERTETHYIAQASLALLSKSPTLFYQVLVIGACTSSCPQLTTVEVYSET